MKTLKDFYIVVTKQNCDELRELTGIETPIGLKMTFTCDNAESACYGKDTKNKERVSLYKLKRYIANIPNREALKKAQNASKLHKYRYEQEKKFNEASVDLLDSYLEEISSLQEKVCKWKGLHYESSTRLDFANDKISDLRKEREQLTYLAKKDVNLGKKTLIEWVCDIYNNEKYLQKECSELAIQNNNLELNNTKLNLENDQLNKELKKHKLMVMASLIITLLALGLWI